MVVLDTLNAEIQKQCKKEIELEYSCLSSHTL